MFLDLTPTQKIARKGHKKPGKVKKKAPNEVELKKKQKKYDCTSKTEFNCLHR